MWLKNELEEAQQRTKNEIERNIDLVNASRELEELLRIKDEEISDLHSQIAELKMNNHQDVESLNGTRKEYERLANNMQKQTG